MLWFSIEVAVLEGFIVRIVRWQIVLACGKAALGTVGHCDQRLWDGWVLVRTFELELLRSFSCGVLWPVD